MPVPLPGDRNGGAVIGVNLVALGVGLLLLSCQSAFNGLPLALALDKKHTHSGKDSLR